MSFLHRHNKEIIFFSLEERYVFPATFYHIYPLALISFISFQSLQIIIIGINQQGVDFTIMRKATHRMHENKPVIFSFPLARYVSEESCFKIRSA